MDTLKARIVYHVNRLLRERGQTAKGLCRQSTLSYGTLRRALGDRDIGMSTRSICSISEALGIDPHELTLPIHIDE